MDPESGGLSWGPGQFGNFCPEAGGPLGSVLGRLGAAREPGEGVLGHGSSDAGLPTAATGLRSAAPDTRDFPPLLRAERARESPR